MQLQQGVAVVTGAASGIGAAVAQRLAVEGMQVVVADVDATGGERTVHQIVTTGGQATFRHADVTVEADVAALIAAAESQFGGLDVVVNNAGGVSAPYFPFSSPAQWQHVLDLNLRSAMLGVYFGVQAMQRRGGGGAIINIASVGGVGFAPYDKPEYGAAKAGVMRLTASLGSLRDHLGIRVNCICPGFVDTPSSQRERAAMTAAEQASLPPVLLRPEEIAAAVVYFAADDTLGGRVMLWQEGRPWQMVPVDAPY